MSIQNIFSFLDRFQGRRRGVGRKICQITLPYSNQEGADYIQNVTSLPYLFSDLPTALDSDLYEGGN